MPASKELLKDKVELVCKYLPKTALPYEGAEKQGT